MSTFQQFNNYPYLTPCRVVATSNQSGTYLNGPLNNGVGATFTYATGALTIDSVTVNQGDSVLFVGQSSANQNGIYVCTQAGATGVSAILQRRSDMQCIEQLLLGQYVSVSAGTVNAGAMYAVVEPKPAHFGVDNLAFTGVITSGLGTASTKATTDNTKASVAAVTGSFTANNFTFAADTSGTIKDSGYNVNNILQYASVTISAAQFNGMYATPKQLIAAPGANKLILVEKMELIMTFGASQFAAGGVVAAQYDSTANGAGVAATNTEQASDFTGAAASTTFYFTGVSGNTVGALPFSTTVNKGLYLSNTSGAFTTGDSTFVCNIHYRVVATA